MTRNRWDLLGSGDVTIWRVEGGEVDAVVVTPELVHVTRRQRPHRDDRRCFIWECTCPLQACIHIEAVSKIVPPTPGRGHLGSKAKAVA